jgi:hypothetical protein
LAGGAHRRLQFTLIGAGQQRHHQGELFVCGGWLTTLNHEAAV